MKPKITISTVKRHSGVWKTATGQEMGGIRPVYPSYSRLNRLINKLTDVGTGRQLSHQPHAGFYKPGTTPSSKTISVFAPSHTPMFTYEQLRLLKELEKMEVPIYTTFPKAFKYGVAPLAPLVWSGVKTVGVYGEVFGGKGYSLPTFDVIKAPLKSTIIDIPMMDRMPVIGFKPVVFQGTKKEVILKTGLEKMSVPTVGLDIAPLVKQQFKQRVDVDVPVLPTPISVSAFYKPSPSPLKPISPLIKPFYWGGLGAEETAKPVGRISWPRGIGYRFRRWKMPSLEKMLKGK